MHAEPRPSALYKAGDLASLAGVSVRTLHHYEEVGLLLPSRRTASGHRLYTAADLGRLARIKALAALGFDLERVRQCLDDEAWSPLRLVEAHLAGAREELSEQQALCARLQRLCDDLRRDGRGDDVARFLETVEVMNMIESYYTEAQLAELARRRQELGEEAIRRVEDEWQALFGAVEAEIARGTPPAAPAAQALAARWGELTQRTVASFTGGDPGVSASLRRLYAEQPVDRIHPSFDPKVFAYIEKANQTRGGC
jgi:DNA-binding transcriptional MerR regulator